MFEQNQVNETVKNYFLNEQAKFKEAMEYNRELKDAAIDSRKMTTQGKNMRLLGSIPGDLMRAVEAIDPDTFKDKKKAIQFFKTYKTFALADL